MTSVLANAHYHPMSFLSSSTALEYVKIREIKAAGVVAAGKNDDAPFWIIRRSHKGYYEVLCTDNKFRPIDLWAL